MRIKYFKYRIYCEGEGGDSGDPGAGAAGAAGAGTAGAGAGAGSKTFTQAEVDGIIQQRLAKEKETQRKMSDQLKSLQQSANLTAEEKKQLQSQLEEWENKFLTKEEQAAKERNRLQEEFQSSLKKTTQERDTWQKRYTDATIQQALTAASLEAGAENPRQMMMMFQGSSYLQENVGDDGKPNGTFSPFLRFQGLGEDKKTVKDFELPVDQAIKKIKEDGLNKNLFKATGVPGTGPNPDRQSGGPFQQPGTMPRPENYPGNPEAFQRAYSEWRQEYNLDGSKKRKT